MQFPRLWRSLLWFWVGRGMPLCNGMVSFLDNGIERVVGLVLRWPLSCCIGRQRRCLGCNLNHRNNDQANVN
jgi:hypothetical protein